MRNLAVLLGAVLLQILWAGAGAADPSVRGHVAMIKPAERCQALQIQFDAAMKGKLGPASARSLRDQGVKLCSEKRYALGSRKIGAALVAIGLKPNFPRAMRSAQ